MPCPWRKIGERYRLEAARVEARVRKIERGPSENDVSGKQEIDIERARPPNLRGATAHLPFDLLRQAQQAERRQVGLDGAGAVEKRRLVEHAGRGRLVERRDGGEGDEGRQAAQSGTQVEQAVAQVAAQRQVDRRAVAHARASDGGPRSTAWARRAAAAISRTSCTRTMSAPPAIASAVKTAFASRRCGGSAPRTRAITLLRERATSIGKPRSRSSPSRLSRTRFSCQTLPKPKPGSMMMRSAATPATRARQRLRTRSARTRSTTSGAVERMGDAPAMTITASARAATAGISGSPSSPDTSLRMRAPRASAARATAALRVSMLTGTRTASSTASSAGSTRRSSSSSGTGTWPGRVDSPPTSMISAPARSSARALGGAARIQVNAITGKAVGRHVEDTHHVRALPPAKQRVANTQRRGHGFAFQAYTA